MKKIIVFIPALLLIVACTNRTSNTELFKKHYEKNVNECVKGMLLANVDSAVAVTKCNCMLNTLFEIDSSFVKKDNAEINLLIEKHKKEIDSLCY